MVCPRCGAQILQGVSVCPRCRLPQQFQHQPPQFQPAPAKKSSVGWIVALGLSVGVILALVITLVVVVLVGRGSWMRGIGDDETVTAAPSPTSSAPAQSESAAPEKTKKSNDLGDVRNEPAGLFCRDLESKGYSYVAAVDYWRMNGQPNQMDADRNGIPCETVFSAGDVEAYWGPQGYVPDSYSGIETLPSGLYCRDLYSRGYSYPQAVDYWWYNGVPDRMDEDLNGIPCESVYPAADVSFFWFG